MLPTAESVQIILPIISVLFLALSFKRTIFGVISYFIILNAKLGDMYPTLGAIRFELLAAIVVFISILISGKGLLKFLPQHNLINRAFWMLFGISMLSVLLALNFQVSWDNGGYGLFKLALFYIMIVTSINEERDLKIMIWAFVLITFWTAYDPVVSYLQGIVSEQAYGKIAVGRFGAATGHVALANTLNQGLPISVFCALYEKRKTVKFLYFAIIAFIILGIIFTKSRGGFIGLVVTAAGFTYFSKQRFRTFFIFLLLFIFMIPFAGEKYLSHIATIADGVHASRSTSDRLSGLLNGISMMIKRPLLGVGIGGYASARRYYFRYYFMAHNLYGELFGELGIASCFWFYWIYTVFRRSKDIKSKLDLEDSANIYYYNVLTGIQLSLFLRLILGNFTHGSFFWFWILMAALCVSIENVMFREPLSDSETSAISNIIETTDVQSRKLKEG
jgi:hypothetical protein